MDLELSPDQQALADSVREFVEAKCPASLVRAVVEGSDGAGKAVDDLWDQMVALDWPALVVPEEAGGLGLGAVELAVVCEQLGRVVCPAPFLSTASQFTAALCEAATGELRRHLLGALARGGMVGTLAVAEASGLCDADDIEALWSRSSAGYRLSGTKHYVLEADRADHVVVAARAQGSSGHEGIGLFVVRPDALEVVPVNSIDRSRTVCTVGLDGVEVPEEAALGVPGEQGQAVDRIVERATLALTAEMVGTSQAIFDIVLAYVGEREQFGVKIGSFQAVKHKMSNMFVALESARALTYFAALCVDEDDERRSMAVSMAKAGAGDCQKLMAQEGIQSLGGIGYTWEHDMHMFVKRQKVQSALFGTAAEHRARVANHIGL